MRALEGAVSDGPSGERAMLIELAANLQNWPARNVVFERALDRAAHDLLRMASELGPAPASSDGRLVNPRSALNELEADSQPSS